MDQLKITDCLVTVNSYHENALWRFKADYLIHYRKKYISAIFYELLKKSTFQASRVTSSRSCKDSRFWDISRFLRYFQEQLKTKKKSGMRLCFFKEVRHVCFPKGWEGLSIRISRRTLKYSTFSRPSFFTSPSDILLYVFLEVFWHLPGSYTPLTSACSFYWSEIVLVHMKYSRLLQVLLKHL